MLSPSRPAVWQVKTKGLKTEGARLSAFAASHLTKKGLLDMNELKLYKFCVYELEGVTGYAAWDNVNPVLSTDMPVNYAKSLGGVVMEPFKGARDGGWNGFGNGLEKGFGNFLFLKRGMYTTGGYWFGVRSLYEVLKKRFGDPKLGFILATHFPEGFEELRTATEVEKKEVLEIWANLAPEMKSTCAKQGM